MKIGNTTLIPQNIAPLNAKYVVICDSNGNEICKCDLGHLAMPTNLGTKRYSAGVLSDTHTSTLEYYNASNVQTDLATAISWYSTNVDLTFVCGDLAQFKDCDESYSVSDMGLTKHKEIVDANKGDMEVYEMAGNHEHYTTDNTIEIISDDDIKQYTNFPLYYTVSNQPTDETERNYYSAIVGEDVYIMCGNMGWYECFNDTSIQWLYETLETYRNRRCFLFVHPPLDDTQHCGDALNVITYDGIGSYKSVFVSLLKHYKNVIYFHGHTHAMLEMQDYLQGLASPLPANYDFTDGVHSVHIPSLAISRDISSGERVDVVATSQGYLMDVYDNHIVLQGRDFVAGEFIPLGTYCLDTTLQTVQANTFTDSTGTITTQSTFETE